MKNKVYIVVGTKSWNRTIFEEIISKYSGQWHFIKEREQLTLKYIQEINPRYIFFIHWSWKVEGKIINNYECVCFHMTDVPYGRGGSPLQNLIIRGHRNTKLAALKMTENFDAGPVYLKEDLSLEGNAEEIYIRSTYLAAKMIKQIISKEPTAIPQTGKAVIFKRRKSNESKISEIDSLQALHDFIRMLDAEGYPKAFFNYKGFRYEFSRAIFYNGRIIADVLITPTKDID